MSVQHRIPVEETFSWQRPVINLTASTPPVSPVKGDRYVVKATGTDEWTGQENNIAWYDGAAWKFDVPTQGWAVYDKADNAQYYFSGSVWVKSDVSTKQALVPGAVMDNLTSFGAAGQVKDSGVSTPVYDAGLGALIINL